MPGRDLIAELRDLAEETGRHVFICTRCGWSGREEKHTDCDYFARDCGPLTPGLSERIASIADELDALAVGRSVATGTESTGDSAVRPTASGHASAGEPPREPALPPTDEIERFEGEGGRCDGF